MRLSRQQHAWRNSAGCGRWHRLSSTASSAINHSRALLAGGRWQGDALRHNEGILLSAHRAGAMTDALLDIGAQALADAELILRGLARVVCRRAQRETVGRSRSKPISRS